MRWWPLLLLLSLLITAGCITERPCTYFLEEEHYSLSSYSGCITREAVSYALEGDVADAINECRRLNQIVKAKIGGLEFRAVDEYNACITAVAKASKREDVCNYIEVGAVQGVLDMLDKAAQLIPLPQSFGTNFQSGTSLINKGREVCRKEVEYERRRDQAMSQLWDNIMDGIAQTFTH